MTLQCLLWKLFRMDKLNAAFHWFAQFEWIKYRREMPLKGTRGCNLDPNEWGIAPSRGNPWNHVRIRVHYYSWKTRWDLECLSTNPSRLDTRLNVHLRDRALGGTKRHLWSTNPIVCRVWNHTQTKTSQRQVCYNGTILSDSYKSLHLLNGLHLQKCYFTQTFST